MNGPSRAKDEALRTFSPAATSARAARQWIAPVLDEWGVNGQTDDVLLVVSELVTNAVVHGDGPVAVRVARLLDAVRVEVSDIGAGSPAPRVPDLAAPGGRGFLVIDHLARCWGVDRHQGPGKTVWAEVPPFPTA